MDYCFYCMQPTDGSAAVCPFCGNPRTAEVPPHHLPCGTVLRNRYLIGAALGEGGFGITYIGRDTMLNLRVAVKEYYPNGYTNRSSTVSLNVFPPTSGERREFFEKGRNSFLNEARTMGSFSEEPGIVNVRDFFEENNTAYIVMEYLDGVTMKTYLKQNGVMRYNELLPMMLPLMRSLQKVHEAGLVHRDISPDNIMIVGDRLKLLDFGAARNVSVEGNRSLSVMLKPGYAPEEQYRSRGKQGPWTDVYALCATIYKCLTGVTPDDSAERVNEDTLQPPSALGVEIPPAAEKALMRGLAVSAQNRIQSVEELMNALLSADNAPLPSAPEAQPEDTAILSEPDDDVYTTVMNSPKEEGTAILSEPDDADNTMVMNEPEEEDTALLNEPEDMDDYTMLMGGQLFGAPVRTADEATDLLNDADAAALPAAQPAQKQPKQKQPKQKQPKQKEPKQKEPKQKEPKPAQSGDGKKSKGKAAVIAAVIAVVAVAAIVVGILVMSRNKVPADTDGESGAGTSRTQQTAPTADTTKPAYEDPTDSITDDYIPQWVLDYDPVFSDDDIVFELDYCTYGMQVPLQYLLNDGWMMYTSTGKIASGDELILTLNKNSYCLNVIVYNSESEPVDAAYCAVTGIEVSGQNGEDPPFAITLYPNYIYIGMSEEEFSNVFPAYSGEDYYSMVMGFAYENSGSWINKTVELWFEEDSISIIRIAPLDY